MQICDILPLERMLDFYSAQISSHVALLHDRVGLLRSGPRLGSPSNCASAQLRCSLSCCEVMPEWSALGPASAALLKGSMGRCTNSS